MIKNISAAIWTLLFLAVFAGNVYAAGDFDKIYMTDRHGGTNQVTSFGWDEKPWLYLKLPAGAGNLSYTNSSWTDPFGAISATEEYGTTAAEAWLGFDDWNTIRRYGLWSVYADYEYYDYPSDPTGHGTVTFTVTPEPVSSVLFLFGAAVLAAGYKKKILKKIVKNA